MDLVFILRSVSVTMLRFDDGWTGLPIFLIPVIISFTALATLLSGRDNMFCSDFPLVDPH
jgi:hypothetical protein